MIFLFLFNDKYYFCIIKMNMILRKINLIQSASMCWAIIGPTTQKPPLVRSSSATVGPTTLLKS